VRGRNTYGHPGKEVLARLAEIHVLTYRIDFDGAVTLYLDGAPVAPSLRDSIFLHSTDIDFSGVICTGNLAVFLDHATGLVGILFPYQNNRAANAG